MGHSTRYICVALGDSSRVEVDTISTHTRTWGDNGGLYSQLEARLQSASIYCNLFPIVLFAVVIFAHDTRL